MDMNNDTFTSQESLDSYLGSRPEENLIIQGHLLSLLDDQVHQMRSENSNTFSLPQGRTILNDGDDGGYQQFAVNGLAPGFVYRGRTSSRGNISTASSLSPKIKVPQNPDSMFARLASTKSTMSGG